MNRKLMCEQKNTKKQILPYVCWKKMLSRAGAGMLSGLLLFSGLSATIHAAEIEQPVENIIEEMVSDPVTPEMDSQTVTDEQELLNSGILDTEPPVIHSITLSATTVKAPGSIEVIVDATDDVSGVKRGAIWFDNKATGSTGYAEFSAKYYDESKNEYRNYADGKLHGTLTIDRYARPGEYSIIALGIEDNASNNRDFFVNDETRPMSDALSGVKYTVINSVDDSTPPAIQSIKLNTKTVKAPGCVEVLAEATDDLAGVNVVNMYFTNKESGNVLFSMLEQNKDGKWHGTIEVGQYCSAGEYCLSEILLMDNAQNERNYGPRDNEEPIPNTLAETRFTVNNPEGDGTPPVIHGIEVRPTTVNAPGHIEVIMDATDDSSGMRRAEVGFYNSTYDHWVAAEVQPEYTDHRSGERKRFEDGKLHGELSVDQYGRPGEYKLQTIYAYDNANNCTACVRDDDQTPMPKNLLHVAFTVNNDGTGVDMIASTDSGNLAEQIRAQDDDAAILLDYSNNPNVGSDVFDAVKGTNKTLVMESEGVQWVFNGNDMLGENKNVNLDVHVNYVDQAPGLADASEIAEAVEGKPTVVLSFPENGTLPGRAKVRIKADYSMRQYLGQNNVYVYYVDNVNHKMVMVAQELSITPDSYFEFEITHCSSYIMTKGPLAAEKTSDGSSKDPVQVDSFVTRMYTVALNRSPDACKDGWVSDLLEGKSDGAALARGFICSNEFAERNLSNEQYVDTLYASFFARAADPSGKAYWMDQLASGRSRSGVLSGFVNSDEFGKLCDFYSIARGTMEEDGSSIYNEGVRNFVLRCYRETLGRKGEAKGVEYWTHRINTGEMSMKDVAISFLHSQEFLNKNLDDAGYVTVLYWAFLDRGPDETGFNGWTGQLAGGAGRDDIVSGFSDSPEFAGIMAQYSS